MENKGFQIDANILSRKKKNNNSSNRNNNINNNSKKTREPKTINFDRKANNKSVNTEKKSHKASPYP